jgi:hypothetical protein
MLPPEGAHSPQREVGKMRRTILVMGVVGTAALVMLSTPVVAQMDVHVVWQGNGRVQFLDFRREGLRVGDRVAARGPLLDATQTSRVGTVHLDCVVASRITDGRSGPGGVFRCSYLLDLTDGDLVLEGLDPHGPGVYTVAVLGGTGAYAAASGEATLTDTKAGTVFMIDVR